jgi:hypothetical protein
MAFAVSAAHELRRAQQEVLSVEFLHWASRQNGNEVAGDGASAWATMAALDRDGQPDENVWPYDPALRCDDPAYAPPPLHGHVCHTRSSHFLTRSIPAITQSLDSGNAPVLVLTLTWACYHTTTGVLASHEAESQVVDLHALLAAGYGIGPNGDTMIVVRNSWGEGWGARGHGLVSSAYLTRHLKQVVELE